MGGITNTGKKFKLRGNVAGSALTTKLTTLTCAAANAADYALVDPINTSAWGFNSSDECRTLVAVIINLQARTNELEARLQALGLLK